MLRPMRIVSGVQSSGKLHLGNYYGAIRQFLRMQGEGECLYFIADLHALTSVRDGAQLRQLSFDVAAAYLALGLDPARATLFRQSDIPEIPELYWILGTVVPMSHLERAHSYKDKMANGVAADFGLFAYPVLMAADILLYGAESVPVGKDQIQHVEFARDWATKFNVTYVPRYNPQDPTGKEGGPRGILVLPQARIQDEVATLPGTDGQKMSKSYNNTVELFGEEKDTRKRFMGIKTDSTAVEAPKPTEGSAVHALMKVMLTTEAFASADESWRAGGRGYGEYKKMLFESFLETFGPARERYAALQRSRAEVEDVLSAGAKRARAYAAPFIEAVRRAVGAGLAP